MLKLCYRKTCISTKYNQKVKWRPLCHLHCRTLRSPVTVLCLSLHPSLRPSLVLHHVRYYYAIAPCTVVISCMRRCTCHAYLIAPIMCPSSCPSSHLSHSKSCCPMGLWPVRGDMTCAMADMLTSQQSEDVLERKQQS